MVRVIRGGGTGGREDFLMYIVVVGEEGLEVSYRTECFFGAVSSSSVAILPIVIHPDISSSPDSEVLSRVWISCFSPGVDPKT